MLLRLRTHWDNGTPAQASRVDRQLTTSLCNRLRVMMQAYSAGNATFYQAAKRYSSANATPGCAETLADAVKKMPRFSLSPNDLLRIRDHAGEGLSFMENKLKSGEVVDHDLWTIPIATAP